MGEEPRERLRAVYLWLLKTAGRWERVVEVDPSDEEAHRELMQHAIDAGDLRGAVRQFERLSERLRADLGVGPDPKSVALYERAISRGGPDPPTAAERTRALLARGLVQLNTGELDLPFCTVLVQDHLVADGVLRDVLRGALPFDHACQDG